MTQENNSLVTGTLRDETLILQIQPTKIHDPETSERLGREMISLADENGAKDLVLDFSNVQFMGSIGFLALMGLRRHVKGPQIILCGLNATLKEVFEVCKLISSDPAVEPMFNAVDTVQQAQDLLDAKTK